MNSNPSRPPRSWRIFWSRLGGGSLAFSLFVHAVVIALAALIIQSSWQERNVSFLPGSQGESRSQAAQQATESVRVHSHERLAKSSPMRRIVSVDHSSLALPELPADLAEPSPLGLASGMTTGPRMHDLGKGASMGGNFEGVHNLPGATFSDNHFRGRCGGTQDRLTKLRANGGNNQCEQAVSRSLQWLKEHQNGDGSWGRTHPGAMTGLALLTYLGRCETPESDFYGENVTKGIQYLIELAAKNTYGIFSGNPMDHAASYDHGIGTYALGEMYAMARMGSTALPGMREAFEKGVQVIIENQLPDGGWGYGDSFCYRKMGPGDLSVTGWQYQALKAADYSHLKTKGLSTAIERAVKYLASRQTKDGGFGNADREQGYNQWNLTGTALLGLQTLGHGKHPAEIRKGLRFAHAFFTQEPPSWTTNANLYTWYYYAQTFFQSGGDTWKQWNDAVLPELLSHQKPDGSWQDETFNSQIGSTAAAGADRPVYRTVLCTLMLEVYFRYLRVGDREGESIFQK